MLRRSSQHRSQLRGWSFCTLRNHTWRSGWPCNWSRDIEPPFGACCLARSINWPNPGTFSSRTALGYIGRYWPIWLWLRLSLQSRSVEVLPTGLEVSRRTCPWHRRLSNVATLNVINTQRYKYFVFKIWTFKISSRANHNWTRIYTQISIWKFKQYSKSLCHNSKQRRSIILIWHEQWNCIQEIRRIFKAQHLVVGINFIYTAITNTNPH